MAYEVVNDFAAGLDNRKSPVTAPGGTLTRLTNAVINPGGEIEKRRAFVKVASVPTTFGLAATDSSLYVFGRNADPTVPDLGMPGVTLRGARIANTDPTLEQSDYDIFDGYVYLACRTDQNAEAPFKTAEKLNPHYHLGPRLGVTPTIYDGVETEGSGKGYFVRTFQSKVYAVTGKYMYFSAVGNAMVWDRESYIDAVVVTKLDNLNPAVCTVSTGEINQFLNGNVVYLQGVTVAGLTTINNTFRTIGGVNNALGTFQLTGVNGTAATTDQVDGKIKATPAIRVLSISNTNPAVCTVSATDIVKFTDGQKVRINGLVGGIVPPPLASNPNSNMFVIDSVNNPANTFKLTGLNASGFSAAQSADTWATLTTDAIRDGAGYINMSTQDASSEKLTSIEVYYDKLAVFSTRSVQLWAVDPDPLQNAFVQLLRDGGTNASRSPLQYGSGDVLYLDQSGVRSLKAKDSSNSAAVSDIGSPIDEIIRRKKLAAGDPYMGKAVSLLEPSIGRFWMIFPDHIYVLSYFPGPKITAWSEFTLPELAGDEVTFAAVSGGRIFLRTKLGDIWVYGGIDNNTYNQCEVDVRLPYLNGKKPGHNKLFEAIDMTIEGEWHVHVSYNFNDQDSEETVGTFAQSTWNGGRAELTGYASHISLRFHNHGDGFCKLSNVAVHYQVQDDEQ
jgi:hypothetical protein